MEPTAKPAYRTYQFWVVVALTNIGLALASGAIMDGSKEAQVIGWLTTLLSGLGLRGWAPKDEGTTPPQS